MTVVLPIEPTKWPLFRVLTCKRWSLGTSEATSGSTWKIEKMLSQTRKPDESGLRVISYSRCLLPQTGTARLAYSYGRFLDKFVGIVTAGAAYDPTTDSVKAPDLTELEIRIQAAMPTGDPNIEPLWATVFWGTCEYQIDGGHGAAAIPAGERVYHLVDGLDRLKRWPVNSHHFVDGSQQYANAYGNPGYNTTDNGDAVKGGNKDSTSPRATRCGAPAKLHTRSGTKWTDQEAVENMLANSTPSGQPLFAMTGSIAQFNRSSAHEVHDEMTALDFLNRAVSRGKGNGAVGLYLVDSGMSLTVSLKCFPQIAYDVNYAAPSNGVINTILGAQAAETIVSVDVIGDHRFVDGSLMLGDPKQYDCDYNETMGERIQVLASIGVPDLSLEEDWTGGQAASFRSLAVTDRRDIKWFPVYQSYRLTRGTSWNFGNGIGTQSTPSCAYSCDDSGALLTTVKTSPGTVELMDDLPLFDGYVYDGMPVRADGLPESGTPARQPPFFFFKNSTFITPGTHIAESLSLKIHLQSIQIYKSDDQAYGSRYISDPAYTSGSLGTQLDYHNLGITIGLRMPHRARLASGTPGSARTRRTILPGLHLWMASPSAIWAYTYSSGDKYIPLTGASAGAQYILRDDRDDLARLHFLSVAWYGPSTAPELGSNTAPKRNASWSLRCCPDIPSTVDYDGGGVIYPMIGQIVDKLGANGQQNDVLTPVSSITYDNESGIATWVTDWQDLDFQ